MCVGQYSRLRVDVVVVTPFYTLACVLSSYFSPVALQIIICPPPLEGAPSGAARCPCARLKSLPRSAAPFRGVHRRRGETVPSAHTGERGRQSYDMSRAEKKDHTINNDKKLPHGVFLNCAMGDHHFYHRMKFVLARGSCAGAGTPAALPASMQRSSHAIFSPSVRMICMPSASCRTSSGFVP